MNKLYPSELAPLKVENKATSVPEVLMIPLPTVEAPVKIAAYPLVPVPVTGLVKVVCFPASSYFVAIFCPDKVSLNITSFVVSADIVGVVLPDETIGDVVATEVTVPPVLSNLKFAEAVVNVEAPVVAVVHKYFNPVFISVTSSPTAIFVANALVAFATFNVFEGVT